MLMTFLTIWKWENILSEKNCQRKCVEESFHRQCQHQCYRRSAPTESACTCAKNHSQSVYVFGSAIDIHTCKQRQHLESICIQWCNIRKTMLLADYKQSKSFCCDCPKISPVTAPTWYSTAASARMWACLRYCHRYPYLRALAGICMQWCSKQIHSHPAPSMLVERWLRIRVQHRKSLLPPKPEIQRSASECLKLMSAVTRSRPSSTEKHCLHQNKQQADPQYRRPETSFRIGSECL